MDKWDFATNFLIFFEKLLNEEIFDQLKLLYEWILPDF